MLFSRNKAALTANTSYVVGTTPTGYVPVSAVIQMIPAGRDGGVAYFSITSGGEVRITPYINVVENEYIYGRAVYLTI